jgi:hypothetical protein
MHSKRRGEMKFRKGRSRPLLAVLSASIAFHLGCATIIKGGGESVSFKSNPSDADVKVIDARNGTTVASGKTPLSVKLDRGAGYFKGAKYNVVIEKPGFSKKEFVIDSSLMAGWYLVGNLLFGGLIGWFIVDPATGAMWTLDPVETYVELVPTAPPSAAAEAHIVIAIVDDLNGSSLTGSER